MCQNTVFFRRRAETMPPHFERRKVEFRFAPACEGPGSFQCHELIVYIITHSWSPSSPQRRNKQDAYQNHYSQAWKAVTFACVTFVCLPCPTYWPIVPGQVKYVPPATARPAPAPRLMEHVLGEGDGKWQGLYIILRWKNGAMTINQYRFHALSRKKTGPHSILENLPFAFSCCSKQGGGAGGAWEKSISLDETIFSPPFLVHYITHHKSISEWKYPWKDHLFKCLLQWF